MSVENALKGEGIERNEYASRYGQKSKSQSIEVYLYLPYASKILDRIFQEWEHYTSVLRWMTGVAVYFFYRDERLICDILLLL